jgi:hypothetical protein
MPKKKRHEKPLLPAVCHPNPSLGPLKMKLLEGQVCHYERTISLKFAFIRETGIQEFPQNPICRICAIDAEAVVPPGKQCGSSLSVKPIHGSVQVYVRDLSPDGPAGKFGIVKIENFQS